MLFAIIASAVAGYVAAVFSWPKVKEIVNGAEAEYEKVKASAAKLKAKF